MLTSILRREIGKELIGDRDSSDRERLDSHLPIAGLIASSGSVPSSAL